MKWKKYSEKNIRSYLLYTASYIRWAMTSRTYTIYHFILVHVWHARVGAAQLGGRTGARLQADNTLIHDSPSISGVLNEAIALWLFSLKTFSSHNGVYKNHYYGLMSLCPLSHTEWVRSKGTYSELMQWTKYAVTSDSLIIYLNLYN